MHLETWKCKFVNCQKICSRREIFKQHLTKDHRIKDDREIEEQLDKCKLGRHCDRDFWCGFCRAFQHITQQNVNCWSVRCDHIDDHICGRQGQPKRSMHDWVQVEEVSDEKAAKRKSEEDSNPRVMKQRREATSTSYEWKCVSSAASFS